MKSVEEAYQKLAEYVLAFIEVRAWEKAGCHFNIYSKMASGSQWLLKDGLIDEKGGFGGNSAAIWEGTDAAVFLRDDLLKTTHRRIWGLTFTLHPNGKFNIEYDYNKPDGYEETDEIISLSEALDGLSGGADDKSPK